MLALTSPAKRMSELYLTSNTLSKSVLTGTSGACLSVLNTDAAALAVTDSQLNGVTHPFTPTTTFSCGRICSRHSSSMEFSRS